MIDLGRQSPISMDDLHIEIIRRATDSRFNLGVLVCGLCFEEYRTDLYVGLILDHGTIVDISIRVLRRE